MRFNNNNWNIKDEYLLVHEQYLYYLLYLYMYTAQYYSETTVGGSRVTSIF
jgi:tRNA A22 N-methylase